MSDIENRITDYLFSGGILNPELAIHDRVRDLLIDCRDEIARIRADVERLRTTDAEREAIKSAICDYEANDMDAGCWQMAATLRALLARLGGVL